MLFSGFLVIVTKEEWYLCSRRKLYDNLNVSYMVLYMWGSDPSLNMYTLKEQRFYQH